MTIKETIGWLKIMRANLKNFPEISNSKKIEALSNAIDIADKLADLQDKCKDYRKQCWAGCRECYYRIVCEESEEKDDGE